MVESTIEQNLKEFVTQISREKELEPEIVKIAIEQAIEAVSKKNFSRYRKARPELDLETGKLHVFVTKRVVEEVRNFRTEIALADAKKIKPDVEIGEDIEVEIDPSEFGRIAAQSVRQGILQRLKEAERIKTYNDFKPKEGHLVTGVVQRREHNGFVVELGKAEGILPYSEIPPNVKYRYGDRLKFYVSEVKMTPRGPVIRLSRSRPELVQRLFETEVPEISEGVVQIMSIARDPGVRTKIAVHSTNEQVDPVGACVGMKGSRVQMIVRELESEKIDIIPWSSDPKEYIKNALNPAKVLNVELDEKRKRAIVTVSGDSLSVAIGKKGQNAKLAARLTGWQIDIKPEEHAEEEMVKAEIQHQYLDDLLEQLENIPEKVKDRIRESEFNSVERLASADMEKLKELTGESEDLAEIIIESAKEYLEGLKELQAELEESQQQEEMPDSTQKSTSQNKNTTDKET